MCSALAEAQEFHFRKGEHYRNIDWDESAFQEYVKGMKIGEAASALNVAYCYLDEYGTPRNIAKGEQILDTWANKDNEICEFAIIYYYHLKQYDWTDKYYNRNPSRISDKPNYAKSLKFIKLYKAKTGKTHPIMGLFYLKGLGGVPVDTIKAIDIATEKYSVYLRWWPCKVDDVIYQYGMNSPTPERLDMLEKKYPEKINKETKKAFNRKRLELSFGKNIGIDEFKNKLAKSMDLDNGDFYLLMKTLYDAATTEEQKNYINATRTARDLYNCCVNPGFYGNLIYAPKIIKELKSRDYYNEDYLTTEDEEKYAFLNDFILPHLKYNNQCKSLLERISYNLFKSVIEEWDFKNIDYNGAVPVSTDMTWRGWDRIRNIEYIRRNEKSKISEYFPLDPETKLPNAERYCKLAESHVDSIIDHQFGEGMLVLKIIEEEERGLYAGEKCSYENRLKSEGYKTYAEPSLYKRLIEKYPRSEWYQYAVNTLPLAEEYQKDLYAYERAIKVTPDTPKEEIKEIKNIAVSEYMKKRVSDIIKAFKKGKRTKSANSFNGGRIQRDVIFPMPGSVYDKLNSSYSNDSNAMTPAVH